MTNLTLWTRRDPFGDFDERFNAIVRRTFSPTARVASRPAGFVPAADLERDGDDAVVRLELPGLDVDKDVTVEIDSARLIIKGERRDERTADGTGRSLREVRYGAFERSFGLPEYVSADAVTAGYDAGVLTVRVAGAYAAPKPEPTAHRIAVTSGPTDVPTVATVDQPDQVEQPSA